MDIQALKTELAAIKADLATLRDKVTGNSIDAGRVKNGLDRIARIEKHLGLDNKVAA